MGTKLGLGPGTVYTGSSSLLIDLTSIFASFFLSCLSYASCLTHAQETRHIMVQKSTKCVSGGDSREEGGIKLLMSSILIDFDDGIFATD